jgi:hypothetical protein
MSKPKFQDAKQIVSFYGLPGAHAGFYGVYKVLGRREHHSGVGPLDPLCAWSVEWNRDVKFSYELERDARFDDLRDRLVVDWGQGTLAWVQNLDNKEVVEILASGRKLPPFEDYLEFSLTHAQLRDLFENEVAHRDWRIPLSAGAGVYLILAQTTGDLYVGSAYGVDGFWGRWSNYARSGDGGDIQLRELIARDSAYPGQFRFSVLQTLPKTMARDEVIRRETLYKNKLGTRAIGLNSN